MSELPYISKNRLKFKDKENDVLVRDMSELIDSTPVNDARQAAQDVSETSIGKFADLSALKSLQSPMEGIQQSLSSGNAASELLASMNQTVSGATPDMRSVSATISGITSSSQAQASGLTQSLMGSFNQSLSQVPGAIGKVDQISTGVKSYLLKNSVVEYAGSMLGTVTKTVTSATIVLGSANALRQGFGQASQSISAARQRFSPQVSTASYNLSRTTSQINAQRIMDTLQNPAGSVSAEVGTTSQLLPISTPAGQATQTPQNLVDLKFTNHAFLALQGGITWYRSLYTYMFQELQTTHVGHTYGFAYDHYAMLSLVGTDLQDEQLRNFQSLISANTPDNPSKNLFVYKQYQTVLAYLINDLDTLPDKSRIYAVLAYLGQLLPVIPLKRLVTEQDYDLLSNMVSREVAIAANYSYGVMSDEEYELVFGDAFKSLVTTAVVAHRGQGDTTVPKLPEAASDITLYCGVWLMREFLMAIMNAEDAEKRGRLIKALSVIYNTQVEQMTFQFTDYHELVQQGLPIYYRPSTKPFTHLAYPFIKHYHLNRKEILKAKTDLLSDEEKAAFDSLVMRLDALIDSYPMSELQTILLNDQVFNSANLTEQQIEMGRKLSHAMIRDRRLVLDAYSFPANTFERYYTPVENLYFDNTVALMR